MGWGSGLVWSSPPHKKNRGEGKYADIVYKAKRNGKIRRHKKKETNSNIGTVETNVKRFKWSHAGSRNYSISTLALGDVYNRYIRLTVYNSCIGLLSTNFDYAISGVEDRR